MKLISLTRLNTPVDNGQKRSRQDWERWGEKRMSEQDKKIGFVCIVAGPFDNEHGIYFRINFAAQPLNPRIRLKWRG